MKRFVKRSMAAILVVVMLLSAAPLNGFVGLFDMFDFSIEASAATNASITEKLNTLRGKTGFKVDTKSGKNCWKFCDAVAKEIFGAGINKQKATDNACIEWKSGNFIKISDTLKNPTNTQVANLLRLARPGDVIQYTSSYTKPYHTAMIYSVSSKQVVIYHSTRTNGVYYARDLKVDLAKIANTLGSFSGSGCGITLYRYKKYDNETRVYDFCRNTLKLNHAATCGVLANINAESGFKPTVSYLDTNNQTSYGICQWNGGRFTNLKNYCSKNGLDYKKIDSQLKFLKYELDNSYKSVLSNLKKVPNNQAGAVTASNEWAKNFEGCASKYYEQRANSAKNTYWSKYVVWINYSITLNAVTNITNKTATINAKTNQNVQARKISYFISTNKNDINIDGTVTTNRDKLNETKHYQKAYDYDSEPKSMKDFSININEYRGNDLTPNTTYYYKYLIKTEAG